MSELRAASRSKTSTAFWRIYMLSWAVLAGGALTYLIAHTAPPGTLNTDFAVAPNVKQDTKRAELDAEQLSAQVQSLNETVASLRTDLAKYKQAASDRSEPTPTGAQAAVTKPDAKQAAALQPAPTAQIEANPITTSSLPKTNASAPTTQHTETTAQSNPAPSSLVTVVNAAPSATQTAPSTALPSATDTAVQPTVTETQPRRRRNLATTLLRPGSVPPLPPYTRQTTTAIANQPIRDAIKKPVSVVKTAVATAPRTPAFGTPVIKPRQPAASAALSLSTAQSVTGLRASWLLLTTRHPQIFVGYQPRYVADQANGHYRLLAGPIANHSDADRICTELRAQNVSCGVTAYVGSAL